MRGGNLIENKIGWKIRVCNEDLYKISSLPQKYDENNNK